MELWETIPAPAQAYLLILFRQMDELEQRVADLEARLNQNSSNSSKPPSSGPIHQKRRPPEKPSGRKRGGQKGHDRHERSLVRPEQVDEVIECRPSHCRRCGGELAGKDGNPARHQVAELPPIRPHVSEYRLHRLQCPCCSTVTRASLPLGVPRGAFGPRLQSVLSLLSAGYRIGKRGVCQLAHDLLGLSISTGMVCKLQKATSAILAGPVSELSQHVQKENANVDETGWRQENKKAWLWVAVTSKATLFRIATSRAAKVAKAILGESYSKIATCDRYRAYLWIRNCQLCWSHLRRDFQAMIDRGGTGKPIGERLLEHSNQLFQWWYQTRDGDLARTTFQRYAGILRRLFRKDLTTGTTCGQPKTESTCRDLLADEQSLWTFVRCSGIEPTNNAAERALRHAVLWRKSSLGTASETGSRFVERLLSVLATARQHGRDILDYLHHCHQAALYGQPIPSLLYSGRNQLKAA